VEHSLVWSSWVWKRSIGIRDGAMNKDLVRVDGGVEELGSSIQNSEKLYWQMFFDGKNFRIPLIVIANCKATI
jgi:hypothetical protein